jgi:RNA-binding protein
LPVKNRKTAAVPHSRNGEYHLLTSKQRAKLKGIASTTETILQVGKGGIGEPLVKQVDDALTARELIKLRVLETAPEEPSVLAQELAEATGSEVVQVIGRRLVLYRKNPKKPVLLLD